MMRKRGFTLIELSIVLVIIGLLIGGVLVAQSMTSSARTLEQIRQVQQFDVAVNSFQAKFDQLPGDGRIFGGNGNGIIEDESNSFNTYTSEITKFWSNLQQGGFAYGAKTFNDTYVDHIDITSNNPHLPSSILSNKAGIIGATVGWALGGVSGTTNNAYAFCNVDSMGIGLNDCDPAFTVVEVMTIDAKIDDGKPLTGNVQTTVFGFFEWNLNGPTYNCDDFDADIQNHSTAVYLAENTGIQCVMSIGFSGGILPLVPGA